MDPLEVRSRLMTLARSRFGEDAAKLSVTDDLYEALHIDSYQALELLSDLESEFGVEIPDYELQGVQTVEAMAKVIARRL